MQLLDLTNYKDLLNILALCYFSILANILDPRPYAFPGHLPKEHNVQLACQIQFDYNALPPASRQEFTFFWGLPLNFISWMGCYFTAVAIEDHESTSIKQLARNCLLHLVRAILNYKVLGSNRTIEGFPDFDWSDLLCQL
jgi:hypothetical protein